MSLTQSAARSIVEVAAEATARYGDQSAFSCLGASLSYRELDRLSTAFAHWLVQAQQVQPGDRIALQLPNLLQYPVCALGVLKAGAVIVNINPLYTAVELEHQLRDAGAMMLVVCASTAQAAAQVVPLTAVRRVVVTGVGDLHPAPKRQLISLVLRYVKKAVPRCQFALRTELRVALREGAALAQTAAATLRSCQPAAESLAVLQYTGGTTGVPKAAMLSHRNLVANLQQVLAALGDDCPGAGALMVAPLPLYHIYAFTMNLLAGLARGHHTLLIPNPRDVAAFVKALQDKQVNGFVGINTLYKLLCDDAAFCRLDFSQLRISSSGGMSLAPEVAARWQALTGCRILEGYGLSECAPLVACNRYRDYRPATVGRPAPATEICLLDDTGCAVATGDAGEICVRGPQVMLGYWQRPDETAQVLDERGWLHTGDIGVFDADGYLRIVDRIKDLIIVSGFNVYPNEIEAHACAHPDIREAAAIRVGDDFSPIIKLFVVADSQVLNAEQVQAWCRQGLASYKVPKLVEFRDSLPKSNIGKVLRRELREGGAACN